MIGEHKYLEQAGSFVKFTATTIWFTFNIQFLS